MKNVLTDIPYTEGQMGKRQLVDEKHLLVMQVALKAGHAASARKHAGGSIRGPGTGCAGSQGEAGGDDAGETMSSRAPIVHQIAWLSVVPQLTIMGLIMWLLSIAGVRQSIVFGALAYLALTGLPFTDRKSGRNHCPIGTGLGRLFWDGSGTLTGDKIRTQEGKNKQKPQ